MDIKSELAELVKELYEYYNLKSGYLLWAMLKNCKVVFIEYNLDTGLATVGYINGDLNVDDVKVVDDDILKIFYFKTNADDDTMDVIVSYSGINPEELVETINSKRCKQ